MHITQDPKNRTHNFELGGGLESGDGGDYVVGIEVLEERVSVKGGKTQLRSIARSSTLVVKNREKIPADPHHIL